MTGRRPAVLPRRRYYLCIGACGKCHREREPNALTSAAGARIDPLSEPRENPQPRPVVLARPVGAPAGEPPPPVQSTGAAPLGDRLAAAPPLGPSGPFRPLELPLDRRAAGLDTALVLMVAIVIPYLPALVLSLRPLDEPLEPLGWNAVFGKWIEFTITAVLAAYFVLRNRVPPAAFGIHRRNLAFQLFGAPPLILIASYAVIISTAVLVSWFWMSSGQMEREVSERMEFAEALPVHRPDIAIPLMIAVALHEELLFRGMLIPYLRRLTGSWGWAIAGSSLLFAVMHFEQGGMAVVQIAFLALVLAAGFVLTRSLLAVVVTHLAFNLLQLQIMRWLPELERWFE